MAFNNSLFLIINSWAGHSVWLDKLGIYSAKYLVYELVVAVVIVAFKKRHSWGWRMLGEAIISAAIARGVIVGIIRFFYHHPRPFMVEHVQQLIPESGWSFPSGHVTFLFAMSMSLWLYNRKLGYILFGGSLLVGIARIYVGVHWPMDILGGVIVGILTSLVIHWIWPKVIHLTKLS